MTTPDYITAPQGMSYVNAFYALWKDLEPCDMYVLHDQGKITEGPLDFNTAKKVADFFIKNSRNRGSSSKYFVDYAAGRRVKVFFDEFPKLHVGYYEDKYGNKGTAVAKRVLEEYSKVPSDLRLDNGDKYRIEELASISGYC